MEEGLDHGFWNGYTGERQKGKRWFGFLDVGATSFSRALMVLVTVSVS